MHASLLMLDCRVGEQLPEETDVGRVPGDVVVGRPILQDFQDQVLHLLGRRNLNAHVLLSGVVDSGVDLPIAVRQQQQDWIDAEDDGDE